MEAALINRILVRKIRKLRKQFFKISPLFEKDTIHKFRTEIKRLKALMSLVNQTTPARLKLTKKVRNIYRLSGRIRELQLMKEQVQIPQDKAPQLFRYLEEQLRRAKETWDAAYEEVLFDKFLLRTKETDFLPVSITALYKYFDENFKRIRTLDESSTDEELHAMRKVVKELRYNLSLIKEEWTEGYEQLQHLPIQVLDSLAEMLGTYNDEVTLLSKLSDLTSTNKEEQKETRRLCDTLNATIKKQKVAILQVIVKL